MKPEVGTILNLSLHEARHGGVGEQGAAFAAGTVGLIGMVLNLAAKEYDRGADIRFTENGDMRALFAALAPDVADAALKAKTGDGGGVREGRIAAHLGAERGQLRAAAIAHAAADICRGQWRARRGTAYMGRPQSDGFAPPCPTRSLNTIRASSRGCPARGVRGG